MRRKLTEEEKQVLEARKEYAQAFGEYCRVFGCNQIIYIDDFPIEFDTEIELKRYAAELYRRCVREGKPIRAYVTPYSATIERKEGIIYK